MPSPWRFIAESRRGPSHEAEGTPCQDSSRARVLGDGERTFLVACVADGAGSAKYSDTGSSLACHAVVEGATAFHEEHGAFVDLKRQDVLGWLGAAREKIAADAEARECGVREYATTLVGVIAGPQRSFFFQIGDGAIILGNHGVFGVVFWPQSGEYANSTNFITGKGFEEFVEFQAVDSGFTEVAMLTDGLERLALEFDTHTAFHPFCAPLFRSLHNTDDLEGLAGDLRGFLASESVSTRSDDDKTLILASRLRETAAANRAG
ncbi:MAG: PP2C family serine/threonine-protein phosphatase [Planctomycetota bacterium]